MKLLDDTGATKDSYSYDPYGQPTASETVVQPSIAAGILALPIVTLPGAAIAGSCAGIAGGAAGILVGIDYFVS